MEFNIFLKEKLHQNSFWNDSFVMSNISSNVTTIKNREGLLSKRFCTIIKSLGFVNNVLSI